MGLQYLTQCGLVKRHACSTRRFSVCPRSTTPCALSGSYVKPLRLLSDLKTVARSCGYDSYGATFDCPPAWERIEDKHTSQGITLIICRLGYHAAHICTLPAAVRDACVMHDECVMHDACATRMHGCPTQFITGGGGGGVASWHMSSAGKMMLASTGRERQRQACRKVVTSLALSLTSIYDSVSR